MELDQQGAAMTDLADRARIWAERDPDPTTAAELAAISESGDVDALGEAMGLPLEFGTAGIRGKVGPGPGHMNRAVVIRTTRGVADYLLGKPSPRGDVIIGFDARPTSRQFAEDAAGVLVAAGIGVRYFPDYAPTPLVAFAAKHYRAEAAIVVTASHNPPADNGYKVYDSNAAQIIPPTDAAISDAIKEVGGASEVPRLESAFSSDHALIEPVPSAIVDDYWAEIDLTRPVKPESTISIVYTPLHGVGGKTLLDIFSRTVHSRVTPVAAQFEPDGTFPTVAFPNPEEEGALDLALETGREEGATLVIGNDPDADRLAAAIPDDGQWRLLTGNELGVILGSHILRHWNKSETPITACSVVSSPMLSAIARNSGAHHLTTLTGFKWISNAGLAAEANGEGVFAFGYEEALGYTVGRTVRDKDGISAAVLLADVAALEAAAGRTLLDTLADLWDEYGIWVSTQESIVRPGEEGQSEILAAVDHVATNPPGKIGGHDVTDLTDYRLGAENRPPWLGEQHLVEMSIGEAGRVLVRPSGTEPKLKVYVDLRAPTSFRDRIHDERDRLLASAEKAAREMSGILTRVIET
ncbi:MAG TPA: phospho-sugar mutase [Acidimicrobiia bacterium]|nr:phospho-sugar mutase [Acidimicrobiia bacterium]